MYMYIYINWKVPNISQEDVSRPHTQITETPTHNQCTKRHIPPWCVQTHEQKRADTSRNTSGYPENNQIARVGHKAQK